MRFAACLLAGGIGARMGAPVPKQFLDIQGTPMIVRTVATFLDSGLFETVVIAIHDSWKLHLLDILSRYGLSNRCRFATGGATRQASALSALEELEQLPDPPEGVLIHDVARCLVDKALLQRCLDGVRLHGAVTAAIPTTDTIAVAQGGTVRNVPDRATLFRVQTPQGFLLDLILRAHRECLGTPNQNASDDAQLVMALGHPVHLVEGSPHNFKISDQLDLELASALLSHSKIRPGR